MQFMCRWMVRPHIIDRIPRPFPDVETLKHKGVFNSPTHSLDGKIRPVDDYSQEPRNTSVEKTLKQQRKLKNFLLPLLFQKILSKPMSTT